MIGGTVCSNASTYGSVGALGGKPPRATLPAAVAARRRGGGRDASRAVHDGIVDVEHSKIISYV
jgi:hypothetical protein